MTITRNFKLCLNAGTQSAPYINVNQYDRGEVWQFELYNEDGTKYTPSTGAIIGLKSDGNAIANDGTVDSEGRVIITETEQMTAAAGRSVFELLIDSDTHGTANFIVKVEKRPTDDAEFSDSDLSMLQEAIDAASVINEIIGEGGDPSEVITENVNAWLDNHPEATTTVQDGAITAPKINTTLWDKLLVSEEASGAVASFDDGADDVPVKSLKVSIDPVQSGSGDPSPTNIRPITGHTSATVTRTGKNLLQNTATSKTENGITFTVNADGTVTANGTSTALVNLTVGRVYVTAGETYILKATSGGSASTYKMRGVVRNANGGAIDIGGTLFQDAYGGGDKSITMPSNASYMDVYCNVENGKTVTNALYEPMVRLASVTDDTYEPYTGQTVTIDLNGTIYGGTLDVVTGVLTVTQGIYTITSSLTFGGLYTAGNGVKRLVSSNYIAGAHAIMCDKYKAYYTQNNISDSTLDSIAITSDGRFVITSTLIQSASTAADAKSALFADGNIELVYELATPTTVQLTPQEVTSLLGENNIFADTGNVDVIYRADTKLYIDKKIAEV